jgi:nucleoside-diphosphate-sugar epimerase
LGAEIGGRFRRVLVVGGLSFHGASVIAALNARGARSITLCDDLQGEGWRNLPGLPFEDFFSPGELRRYLAAVEDDGDVFSHVFYTGGWADPDEALSWCKTLLQFVAQNGGRAILLGPAAALGADDASREASAGRPEFFAPASRAAALAAITDRLVTLQIPGRSALSLKHYQVLGNHAGESSGLEDLLARVALQVRAGEPVRMPQALHEEFLAGSRKFDVCASRDFGRMVVHLAERESAEGIYEIGSGTGQTLRQIVETICSAAPSAPEVVWEDGPAPALPVEPSAADLTALSDSGWADKVVLDGDTVRALLTESAPAAKVTENGRAEPTGITPRKFIPTRKKAFSGKAG